MTPMTAPRTDPPLDAALPDALAALPPGERLRLVAFRLFARLLDEAPAVAFLEELRETGLVASLVELARESGAPALAALDDLARAFEEADDAGLQAARQDFISLFLAAKHLPAPPWESVYVSQDGLVNQEPAREVLRAYAEASVVFDAWKQLPADHVSLELAFAATLLAQLPTVPEARDRLDRFEKAHLAVWLPRFCADLEAAAKTPLYRHLARALRGLVAAGAEA